MHQNQPADAGFVPLSGREEIIWSSSKPNVKVFNKVITLTCRIVKGNQENGSLR